MTHATKLAPGALVPGEHDLWFLPLGGCGEIGMNMNLYGHNGRWLLVDCGITFERQGEGRPQIQMADPGFIAERREALSGLLITHAHEDHVGAVAHLWPRLRCPVYCTAFTAAILQRKLVEVGLAGRVPVHVLETGSHQQLDGFAIEWLEVTHSTPESQALVIRTSAGSVFHTGDWKLDPDPVVGAGYARERLRSIGTENVVAMVCDSTNADVPGRSISEGRLFAGMEQLVAAAPGRVIVGCFGSNIARMRTITQVARATGRYVALLGRSLHNYVAAARSAGIWTDSDGLIEPAHIGYLPRPEVLAVATGSQGEPGAALHRLAMNNHPNLELVAGDLLLLSSRIIPGNEASVGRLISRLEAQGVQVVQDQALNLPIHASGHPAQDELRDMYGWIAPQIAIPVHGEPQHLQAHAQLAAAEGIRSQLVGRNGDLYLLAPQRGIRRGAVPVGRLALENGQVGPVSTAGGA